MLSAQLKVGDVYSDFICSRLEQLIKCRTLSVGGSFAYSQSTAEFRFKIAKLSVHWLVGHVRFSLA